MCFSPLRQTTATLKKNPRNTCSADVGLSTKFSALQVCTVTPRYLLIFPLFMGMGLMDYSFTTDAGIQPEGAVTKKMLSSLDMFCRALNFYAQVLLTVWLTNRHSSFLVSLEEEREPDATMCYQEPGGGGRLATQQTSLAGDWRSPHW